MSVSIEIIYMTNQAEAVRIPPSDRPEVEITKEMINVWARRLRDEYDSENSVCQSISLSAFTTS